MKKKELRFNLILMLILAAEIALSMYFTYKYGMNNVDADNSSEMVLSRLLADEGTFFSRNWFYSTELRVLNTQIVLSLLFRLTDNWLLVRTLGSGILMAIMVCAYLYMIRETGLGRCGKAAACVLVLPFCQCYQQFALFGLYYIPHVTISFVTAGLFAGIIKRHKGWQIKAVLAVALAAAAGLGGIRMLVVLYCPLVIAAFLLNYRMPACIQDIWRNIPAAVKTRAFVYSFILAAASGIGFIINTAVLSDIFTFKSFNGTEFSDADIFGRSDAILNGLLQFFGYKAGRRVMGPGLVANMLAVAGIVIAVYVMWTLIKKAELTSVYDRFIVLFFAADFCVNMFTFYFADMWEANGNYLIPFMMWLIPVFVIYINYKGIMSACGRVVAGLLAAMVVINSGMEYYEWKNTDINPGKEGIVKFLVNNGYERGYADFWDANVLTEYSQGQLKMCNIRTFDESFAALEWLMDKSYTEWNGDSKVFIVVDNAFSWENRDTLSYLDRRYIVASNNEYCVFAFDNDAQLAQIVERGKHRQ